MQLRAALAKYVRRKTLKAWTYVPAAQPNRAMGKHELIRHSLDIVAKRCNLLLILTTPPAVTQSHNHWDDDGVSQHYTTFVKQAVAKLGTYRVQHVWQAAAQLKRQSACGLQMC